MMNDIVIIALPEEAPKLQNYDNVIFSGVGKINATFSVTKAIIEHRPKRIVNFGTAGSITVKPGLHQCNQFFQRDMNCVALGFKIGQTPYEEYEEMGDGLICASGDSFVSTDIQVKADLVDMEAYAMYKVCKKMDVEFLCYKFITDFANSSAAKDWSELVSSGQDYYIEKIKELKIELKRGKE